MKKFFLLICLSLGLFFPGALAQPWLQHGIEITEDAVDANIYDVKDSFDKWFESRDRGKGSGFKQFQRYLAFMEPRTYPDGVFPEAALWEAYQKKLMSRAKSGSYSADWSHLGPVEVPGDINNGSPVGAGRINNIAFHPTDPEIFYVGAPSGGVWKTSDGGASWRTTTDQLPSLGVSDMAVNPANPDILYMVTGDKDGGNTCPTYSYGILKSTDAGESWFATGLVHEIPSQHRMRRILISPADPNILITAGGPGLYRSADAGETWEVMMTGNFFDLEFKPDDPYVVYACTGNSVFKSTDMGLSFNRLTEGLPNAGIGRIEMAVTLANPEVVYAVMSNSESGFKGLYKSVDSGDTWEERSTEESINIFGYSLEGTGDAGGIAWYAIALAVDQQDENIIYSGSVHIWRSMNGGIDWQCIVNGSNPYVHVDEHTLVVNPLNNYCYSGNDGGIYRSPDRGESWIDISAGLSILQIYKMGASYSDPALIVEGSQDNGTYLYNNGQWVSIAGGDGMECAIDPVNPSIIYASYQSGGLMRSDNKGLNFKGIRADEGGAWITPYQVSPLNPSFIVSGYKAVYLSGNRGDTWHKISDDLTPDGFLNEIAFAPSDDEVIYVSGGSSLWGTKDRGENWKLMSKNLPDLYIEDIVVAHSEPDKVWVSFSGYREGEKVFYSDDGGKNWINYSEGLPNVPVNSLTINKLSNYAMYAGTDIGVYYRNPGLDEWVPYDDGLPNVIVNTVEINYKVNKIRAGTFGRGIWESPVIDDGNWPPAIKLTALEKPAEIVLSWINPVERNPVRYNVYRDNEFYRSVPSNSFTDLVENGMSYTYQVTAEYEDGESVPTNKIMARTIVDAALPYSQDFDYEAHGWLLDKDPSGWQWGTGADFVLPQLGGSNFIAINSVLASQAGKTASAYAILPKMDLLQQDSLIISFDYSLRRWQDLDHLFLVYRTPDLTSWTKIVDMIPSGRMWSWKSFTMEVPDSLYVPEIEFAFYYTDNEEVGYGAAIDNFYIGTDMTGIDEVFKEHGILIFPNPTDGRLNISFRYLDPQDVTIEVIDLTGRVLNTTTINNVNAGYTHKISLDNLMQGQYLIRISGSNFDLIKTVTKK